MRQEGKRYGVHVAVTNRYVTYADESLAAFFFYHFGKGVILLHVLNLLSVWRF